jgi:Arc/MetJ family transcription regulator
VPSHITMCDILHIMATNLALDDALIEEARRTGGHKTKKEAVTAALDEYVRRRKQQKILELFGTVDFDPNYDYKAARNKKRS